MTTTTAQGRVNPALRLGPASQRTKSTIYSFSRIKQLYKEVLQEVLKTDNLEFIFKINLEILSIVEGQVKPSIKILYNLQFLLHFNRAQSINGLIVL